MTSRPYVLAETTWSELRGRAVEIAVLPWGATEAHNLHLPYATDTMQSTAIAAAAAEVAWSAGADIVVLPAIPFGVNTGQRDIPLCINMNPSTQAAVLADIAATLAGNGIPKLVILNGHGGNDFRQMIRELQGRVETFICSINWYAVIDPATYFESPGDHAGELETGMLQHLAPDLVVPLDQAGPGSARRFRVRGLREGWAWAPRKWTEVTTDTGVGNPRAASAEKGRAYMEAAVREIGEFLVELAAADVRSMYE